MCRKNLISASVLVAHCLRKFGNLAIALSILLGLTPALAQIKISPTFVELTLSKGGWKFYSIVVKNTGMEPADYEMTAENMDVDDRGAPLFVQSPGYKRGCASWISFEPPTFSLDAGASQNVKITVRAPKDVAGGYYALIFCSLSGTKDISGTPASGMETGFGFRVSMYSILITTALSRNNTVGIQPDSVQLYPGGTATIPQFAGEASGDTPGWLVEVPVYNGGNTHTIISGEVSIWDDNMRMVGKAPIIAGKGYVFPEHKRIFYAKGEKPLPSGSYLVRAHVRSREGMARNGAFTFSILDGRILQGTESEKLAALQSASLPKFSLQKRFIEFDASPGSKRFKGLRITNMSEDTLKLSAVAAYWAVNADGEPEIIRDAAATKLASCKDWLVVDPAEITIEPRKTKSAKITVNAPKEMSGEYFAAVCFSEENTPGNVPSEFLMPTTVLVSACAKNTVVASGSITSANVTDMDRGGGIFEMEFANAGNAHCYVEGYISIEDEKGRVASDPIAFGSKDEFVFPGMKKKFTIPWRGYLDAGKFAATFTVSFAEKAQSVKKTVGFAVE